MGHNMHELDPVFESFSFSKVNRQILFKAMQFLDPKIVQSMYIFKVGKKLDQQMYDVDLYRMRESEERSSHIRIILT